MGLLSIVTCIHNYYKVLLPVGLTWCFALICLLPSVVLICHLPLLKPFDFLSESTWWGSDFCLQLLVEHEPSGRHFP